MIKIVAISDTHSKHNKVKLPEGDILIVAGDFTSIGLTHEVANFNNWLGKQSHAIKIVCAGNHDRILESDPSLGKNLLTNATYVQHELCEINGLKIWCSPYTPEFCFWAFMKKRGEDILRKWKEIPENIDILVTHGPPHSILDTISPGYENLGCADLYNEVINRIKPKVHIFGHIHGGCGATAINGTMFVNASICDEAYNPINSPSIIDYL